MSITTPNTAQSPRLSIHLAKDHRVETKPQPGQAHRVNLGAIIDYKLQQATGDCVRAISTLPGHFRDLPNWESPWHYHECDLQVAIILDGSLDVAYNTGHTSRAAKGDLLYIPGGVLHDVGGSSVDYQVAEITFPGSFGTVEAPAPSADHVSEGRTLAVRDASLVAVTGGIGEYQYKLTPSVQGKYAIRRYIRHRSMPFAALWREHSDTYRMTYVICGTKEIITDKGELQQLGPLDIAIIPAKLKVQDVSMSDDYEAIEVALMKV